MFRDWYVLRSPEGEGGGGKHGSPGADKPEHAEGSGGAKPAAITEERVTEIVNQAITGRLRRAFSDPDTLERFGDAIVSTIAEKHPKVAEMLAGKNGESKGEGTEPKSDPKVAKLEKELQEMRDRDRRARAKEALAAEFKRHGIEPSGILHDAFLGKVTERDGEFLVGEELLADHVSAFAKTDDAKRFIPARPGSGTGARPSGGAASSPGDKPIDWKAFGGALLHQTP